MSGVLNFLAVVVGAFAANLLLPVLVSATADDGHVGNFLLLAALLLFLAGSLYLALQGRSIRIGRVGSYGLLLLSWVCLSVAGALPFALVGNFPVIDALFESVSGLTTTGSTILEDPGTLPVSLRLWRSQLQWLGGFLTLLSIILVLAPAGVGGLPDQHIKHIEHAGRGGGDFRITRSILSIAAAYGIATLLCFIALVLTRIPLIDAACLTFSTVSTGGFQPHAGTLGVHKNPAAELVITVFMIVGATSLLWQRMILQRRWHQIAAHRESYFLIAAALVVGLSYGIAGIVQADLGTGHVGDALRKLQAGLLTGASLVTTTGFQSADIPFGALPVAAVLVAAFIGGGTFSTAGGIKMYRLGGMVVQSIRELGRLVYPHGIRPAHFGSQPYDMQLMKSIWSFSFVAGLVVMLGTAFFAVAIPDFEGALMAAIANFSNIGPLYGPGWSDGGDWPHYGAFSGFSKSVAMALMLLGRIEILALFGALNLSYWLNR